MWARRPSPQPLNAVFPPSTPRPSPLLPHLNLSNLRTVYRERSSSSQRWRNSANPHGCSSRHAGAYPSFSYELAAAADAFLKGLLAISAPESCTPPLPRPLYPDRGSIGPLCPQERLHARGPAWRMASRARGARHAGGGACEFLFSFLFLVSPIVSECNQGNPKIKFHNNNLDLRKGAFK